MSDIATRKANHLDLATSGDVGFRRTTTLFECVRLVHDALPELDTTSIDSSSTLLGKRLRAPILIAAMTGGTERAERINRELASIAEERGLRVRPRQPARHAPKSRGATDVRRARRRAPRRSCSATSGWCRRRAMSTGEMRELVTLVGADALCVHLNPAMELVQAEGDRDFRGGLRDPRTPGDGARCPWSPRRPAADYRAASAGTAPARGRAARRRFGRGRHVVGRGRDGAGRARRRAALGETFREWGIPTAASVALVRAPGFETIFATGGMQRARRGQGDRARGIAGGIARSSLQALESGGRDAALAFFDRDRSRAQGRHAAHRRQGLAALR